MLKNKFVWMWLYNPPLILIAIVGMHLGWIYGLIANNSQTLSLAALSGISIYLENGISREVLIGILGIATILALIGLNLEPYLSRRAVLLLLVMQYILVFVAMTSDAYVVITGTAKTVVDGQYMKRHVDASISVPLLFGLIWISFWHTYGIIQRYIIAFNYRRENRPNDV